MENLPNRLIGWWLPAVLSVVAISAHSATAQSVDQGKFGRGLKVGQTYASADYNPVYDVLPISVEMWVRVNGKGDASTLISCEPRNAISHWELFSEKETGRFGVGIPGFTPPSVISSVDIADDQWHYVAFVFDGTKVTLFVDGKLSGEAAVRKTGRFPDVGPLNFGFQLGVAPHPDTTIDEVRISKIARKIDGLPDKPFVNDADTMGLWHFDEDQKAYDKSGFEDVSNNRNPAKLKDAKTDGQFTNGGFDNTVGGKTRWADMDYGPFFSSTITPPLNKQNVTHKGISIRLKEQLADAARHACTFDTELLRMSAVWEGAFIRIYPGREGLGSHPEMGAKPLLSTTVSPGWVVGDPAVANAWADPRASKVGPLPESIGKYLGLYLAGESVFLSYAIAGTEIIEEPSIDIRKSVALFKRGLVIGPHEQQITANLCEVIGATGSVNEDTGTLTKGDSITGAACIMEIGQAEVKVIGNRLVVVFPPSKSTTYCTVLLCAGGNEELAALKKARTSMLEELAEDREREKERPKKPEDDITVLQKIKLSAKRHYPPLTTKGTLGKSDGPYTVDTLTAPDDNPWKSFLRFGGVDFLKNGDAAVCSVSGDVWVVSGIDDKLEKLTWKRFATGLFQPLGLRVVDDKIFVLGRDQITKLHDLNGDGEADFYENFNNDGLVTTGGHAYVTSLERDPAGNFYYIKCADSTPQGGSVLRVSPDGKKLDVFATGVRNGNGMGMSPWGQPSFADNEGDWVPASRIDFVNKGQFLGFLPMAHLDPAPAGPGRPIVWMPQNMDNSSGSQIWVQGDKWGLPAGTMLHTSYGQAALLHVLTEKVKLPGGEEVTQGGVWRFPLTFATGIMRSQFRPADGQLYVCGLRGWQTNGTKDGALQRVRYTGKPLHQPTELHVHQNGIVLKFGCELDKETAADAGSWSILQWNYRWSSDYGSKHYSVADPKKQGYDTLEVKKATLLPDGRGVFLEVPNLQPVMQMRISCNIETKDGTTIKTDVYNTIHALGPARK